MPRIKRGKDLKNWRSARPESDAGRLRIVGGTYGGRQIQYSGDAITRPMKDDIREAVFNLVGGWVPGKAVFDLFSGTGAVGLEGMSRGASRAYLIERHFPTVKIIRQNIAELDPGMNAEVVASDSFFWARKFLKDPSQWPVEPWVVFCCPPYDLFVKESEKIVDLIRSFLDVSPTDSLLVVESDSRFQTELLPFHEKWSVRQYTPAVISVFKKFDDA